MEISKGLTNSEAQKLFLKYGPNEIEEKRDNEIIKLLRSLISPTSFMLVAASLLSFIINRPFDGYFIIFLLILNVGVSFWHEHKADKALETLRKKLRIESKVMRDGSWKEIQSINLVVHDFVECNVGSLVPADIKIIEANNLQINESILTGESLPKEKKEGEIAYSGSVVTTGFLRGQVIATGNRAFFGKIVTSTSGQKRRSAMEKDILSISRFLILASLFSIIILTIVFLSEKQALADTLLLDLSLLIAGVPISLPTVMTLIVSLGALSLAKNKALVRRLASLEDFANVTLLLTDKTGTLTENKISVEKFYIYNNFDENLFLKLSAFAALPNENSLIDKAITNRGKSLMNESGVEVLSFTPADSIRKRTTTLLSLDGKKYLVSMGTPPVLAGLLRNDQKNNGQYFLNINQSTDSGSRAVTVAVKENPDRLEDEKEMILAGLFILSDPIRNDAKETLSFLKKQGVNTIMVTGDTKETTAHVTRILGMDGKTLTTSEVDFSKLTTKELQDISSFAEVLPDDKLKLVRLAQKDFTVAMAGDGVNDLPATRQADVGMAVANAVDALKGIADIVFLEQGIKVMQTALIEARKIFFRLYNYSIYRISESFRLIVTTLLLGLIIKDFPLTPVQIILLAFLNDIPIITLAFDRVKRTDRPADLNPKERFSLGILYGLVGVVNSVLLYFIMANFLHFPLATIQTVFFLKLTVSGHLLIYVAHTKEKWWKFLPASSVIWATVITQICATILAIGGIFVTPISFGLAGLVWLWAFGWMQISEVMKLVSEKIKKNSLLNRQANI